MPVAVPITTEQEFPLSVQFSARPSLVKVDPAPPSVAIVAGDPRPKY